jgi:hypothetical protein
MTVSWGVTFDCESPAVVAAFWKTALGYVDGAVPEGFATWREWFIACDVPETEWDDGASIDDPTGVGPRISFLKVPERKTVKNRIHLDVKVSGGRSWPPAERAELIRATADQLTAAGATTIQAHRIRGELDHIVLADPEGNEFCVV